MESQFPKLILPEANVPHTTPTTPPPDTILLDSIAVPLSSSGCKVFSIDGYTLAQGSEAEIATRLPRIQSVYKLNPFV